MRVTCRLVFVSTTSDSLRWPTNSKQYGGEGCVSDGIWEDIVQLVRVIMYVPSAIEIPFVRACMRVTVTSLDYELPWVTA